VGPAGKGILRLLIEAAQFNADPVLKNSCDTLIKEFCRKVQILQDISDDFEIYPKIITDTYLGQSFLNGLINLLSPSLHKKYERGLRVLAQFPDGIGKNRYIALVD
jgi:hypothetical protein